MSGEREYRYPDGSIHVLPGNTQNAIDYYLAKGFTLVEDEDDAVQEPGPEEVPSLPASRDSGALGEEDAKGAAAPKEGEAKASEVASRSRRKKSG